MRRGWKIAAAVALVALVLLVLNAVVLNQETKSAGVTVEGGEVLRLTGGEVQVLDSGPSVAVAAGRESGPTEPGTIVLLHCYTCAIDWWEAMIPRLERRHRVIAIDLLGHGGSEKPRSGYAIEEQGALVAEALSRLGVRRATVVGHSLGGSVATALTELSPDLVSGVVIVDQAPDDSYGDLGFLAKLGYVPVLGQAIWRVVPDAAVEEGLSEAFAPGFDVPDEFVEDYRRMTYSSYSEAGDDEYSNEQPLDERLRTVGVPLLVIFGSEDQIYDAREALAAYARVPGVRTRLIPGSGHSPNVERPTQTARLVLDFAESPIRR